MNANQTNFAYKIRHALNENLDTLPANTADRLTSARKLALSRKKSDLGLRVTVMPRALAGNSGATMQDQHLSWFQRIGIIIPLLALLAGLAGIYEHEQNLRIAETADQDVALLTDEIPVSAYADHGFNAYIAKQVE